jgi:uncharacterized protein (TIGR02001 family)
MTTKEFHMKTIQKSAIALAASGLFATAAFAQSAPAAAPEAPEVSPVTANVTVTNNYIYRGLTQTDFKPAVQGGFDYAHESGFYIGNWNSSISWVSNQDYAIAKSSSIEMDVYAGIKKELIGEGFASDLGVLQYYYPTSGTLAGKTNPNTTELYVAQNFTFGPTTGFLKFSYAVSNIFGTANSKGSYYPDLTVNHDTGMFGVSINAHVGYQKIAGQKLAAGQPSPSYLDYKLGLTKDFGGGLSGSVAYVATNLKKGSGTTYANHYAYESTSGGSIRSQGASTGLISLTKTF